MQQCFKCSYPITHTASLTAYRGCLVKALLVLGRYQSLVIMPCYSAHYKYKDEAEADIENGPNSTAKQRHRVIHVR